MKYWGRQDGDKRVLPGDYNLALHPLTPHPLKPETLECAQKGSLRYHYGGPEYRGGITRGDDDQGAQGFISLVKQQDYIVEINHPASNVQCVVLSRLAWHRW